jgi:Ni/Fe-hydrogenase subunit HybB-like protein
MTFWLRGLEAGLGRRSVWLAFIAVVLGVGAFATGLQGDESPRTLAALIASWLFFAGIAAGALAFVAIFQIIDAGWARPLAVRGAQLASFAPVALILLVVILAGARVAPWLPAESSGSGWLQFSRLTTRELALALVLWIVARQLLRSGPGGMPLRNRAAAVIYCLMYGVVLSVWAFDFVLGPDPNFESTLIGPSVFMAAFIAGTGVLTFLGIKNGALSETQRRDSGAMVLALSIFWAYLFWSQYLTTWYGDLPQETVFALRRVQGGWAPVVLTVIGLVFAVPFAMLLNARGRKSARVLEAVIIVQLVGLWLNCHLLVVPSLASVGSSPITIRDALIALGMLGAFVLSSARRGETTLASA